MTLIDFRVRPRVLLALFDAVGTAWAVDRRVGSGAGFAMWAGVFLLGSTAVIFTNGILEMIRKKGGDSEKG